MHNERCKHHCGCKKFETLLQVTEDVCKYAGIVMASDKILSPAKDILNDKNQHTDQDIKMKELEFEIKTAASTKADYLKEDKKKTSFNDKFGSLVMYYTFTDIKRTENKKLLPGLPENWDINDLIKNAMLAEELDTNHAKEKNIKIKELELEIKISRIKIKEEQKKKRVQN